MENFTERKAPAGLYDPRFEHDNCGIGAVVDIKGRKTHKTIEDALQIVEHLEHRAGKDAEGKTGDGVGILTQISDKFFQKAAAELGIELGKEREYGIGMFFFPQDELSRNQAKKLFEIVCKKEGLPFLGWREVPVCPEVLSGLGVPRPCVELRDGVAYNQYGENVDAAFRTGVQKALAQIERQQIDLVVLQSRSPTCGVKQIYDGTFSKYLIDGQGMLAAALAERGYRLVDVEDIDTIPEL